MVDIVFDSSILIEIAHLYSKNIQTPRTQREVFLFRVKEKMEDQKINIIITPTIKREILWGERFDNGLAEKIMNRYCEIEEFDDYDEAKTLELSDTYGNSPIDGEPAILYANDYLSRNYNDALIVAETTELQKKRGKTIPFLTDNIKKIWSVF